ncbi:hypothetical protein [Geobacter anodireducens]
MVGELEGALDASEIKDYDLIDRWYDYWTPLETRRVIQGNNVDKVKAIDELVAMKSFLLSYLGPDRVCDLAASPADTVLFGTTF